MSQDVGSCAACGNEPNFRVTNDSRKMLPNLAALKLNEPPRAWRRYAPCSKPTPTDVHRYNTRSNTKLAPTPQHPHAFTDASKHRVGLLAVGHDLCLHLRALRQRRLLLGHLRRFGLHERTLVLFPLVQVIGL